MPKRSWRGRAHRIEGEIHIGGQEHFYLETQATMAWLDESGGVSLHSSTQHPSETQEIVARVLGVPRHMVTVECLRMGGAFGGKETQANCFAAVAALGARKTGRPVRVRFSRRLDMTITGKRHPFLARFAAGFDGEGRVQAARIQLYSDGGWSLDLSEAVLGRAMFHVDNAYYLPALEVTGFVCKTHKTSQTAFRGFGGPQGMLVIEDILDRVARTLELPPHVVRERNFYREGESTHYGQPVKDAERIGRIWATLKESSGFAARRERGRLVQCGAPVLPPRTRHHAGQVRHFVHRDAVQSGRRAGAGLPRRQRAGEPRRHGDGAGPLHEDRPDRGGRARREARSDSPDAHAHRQGSEHLGDRGLVRHRPQRRGRAGCVPQDSRHPGTGGGRRCWSAIPRKCASKTGTSSPRGARSAC